MSLQVWLPLTEDLRNQGLLNLPTPLYDSRVRFTNGKLGQYCYGDCAIYHIGQEWLGNTWSLACWVKSSNWGPYNDIILCKNTASSSEAQFYFSIIGGSQLNIGCNAGSETLKASYTFATNTWYHVAATYNGTTLKLYLNGNEFASKAYASVQKTGMNNLGIGCRSQNTDGTSATGQASKCMNDVRIYDHALSPLEVKHLAQGLVLHYPLNRGGLGPSNLLKNGFGEFGSENWSNSNISTDVPSGHSEIKKSYRDNESLEFIPLLRNCTYKFSYWVKAAYSSGYSYPSLKPYDADKLFINTNNCREGFSLSTMTALKKQLNPGDTKIYVDDLSAWNANSGHYYDTVAIFSYTDGQGYTWPDGTYTRNCPAFSSGTEAKTNLDKTNNIITLLSAYTGPTMPIGTKVCASTYGNTYFYPSGGINNSTIADWTYKEGVFSSQHSRLECAKYIRVYAYSSCYQAGMILSNLTLEDMDNNIEYDCSGYGNNGTRVGTFSWSGDTPRYNVSTYASGSASTYLFGSTLPAEAKTVSLWIKCNKTVNSAIFSDKTSGLQIGLLNSLLYINSLASTPGFTTTHWINDEWNHVVAINDNGNRSVYINGQPETQSGGSNYYIHNNDNFYLWKREYNNSYTYTGALSDLRIYATALSADDVMALYHTPIFLSNNGTLLTQGEFVEG